MIIFKFIMIHYAICIIAKKKGVNDFIRNLSQGFKNKFGAFMYEVSECDFCITHHLGVLLIPYLILGNGFDFEYLIYPLISTGAIFLIKTKNAGL